METVNSKEKTKQSRIDRVIDYLKEQAYLSDIDLKEDDCYECFFQQLYDYFEVKGILEFYVQTMFKLVSKCILDQEEISVKNLIEKLELLKIENKTLQQNKIFEEQEIQTLKANIEIPKTKVLN